MQRTLARFGVAAFFLFGVLTSEGQNATSILLKNGFIQWSNTVAPVLNIDQAQSLNGPWVPWTNIIASSPTGSVRIPPGGSQLFFRVSASDPSQYPGDMVLVPAGSFQMGDNYAWDFSKKDSLPVHVVTLSAYYIDRYEVTFQKMAAVIQWAYDHGKIEVRNKDGPYIANTGGTNTLMYLAGYHLKSNSVAFANGRFTVQSFWTNYPCNALTWYGAIAYCNFRSEMEGREKCYSFDDWSCDFTKNGYRLPTEAEYEKASRGGRTGHQFPWPSLGTYEFWKYISPTNANYTPVGQSHAYTPTPVGHYASNGYGLFDISGNIREWCFDWYDENWYSSPDASGINPQGPVTGTERVVRGGGFEIGEEYLRNAYRDSQEPDVAWWYSGFRALLPY